MHALQKLLLANRGRGQYRSEVKAGAKEATLYLYDAIVADDLTAEWWGGVSAPAFVRDVAALDGIDVIHLRINSPGGDVFGGRAMEQALRETKAKVIAHIDGYAASAASYVALAADEVVMAPGAMIMIHKAWTVAYGNSNDLLQTAALLDKIDGTLADTYVRETGADRQQVLDWMAAETWFTAEEAVAAGFADSIAEGSKAAAAATFDLSAYANAPAAAKAAVKPPTAELTGDMSARQAALYDAVESIAEDLGQFDQSSGANGAHYMTDNPFAAAGINCANCALYRGARRCEVVAGDISPNAVCKLWIIPEPLLSANASNTDRRAHRNRAAALFLG